ncbi:MAG: hypothetical protein EXQ58_03185 [Acidobacteria bacterium]|nr:hypothetical protein [Acidobacteriota bacterium]
MKSPPAERLGTSKFVFRTLEPRKFTFQEGSVVGEAIGLTGANPLRFAVMMSIVISSWVAAQPVSGAGMSREALEKKALRIQAIVESKALQAHGMIPMFLRKTDYRLPTAEDYKGAYRHRHLKGKSEEELGLPPMHVWRAWENTTSDTAFYLGALSYQYRATGDPNVLKMCRRTFGALKTIYDLGAQDEPGFVTKPYGGKYSRQSSGDQVQCLGVGLEAYRHIAPPADRAVLDEMLRHLADFQIKYRYAPKHGYFAHSSGPATAQTESHEWSDALIYIPLLRLAWEATGDARYLRENEIWYKCCGVDEKWPVPTGTVTGYTGHRMFYLPSLMMEMDPANHELWRSMMFNVFRTLRTGVLPDGTAYTSWTHDLQTGKTLPRDPGFGGGSTRTGRIAIFARACVNAQRWFPNENMTEVARRILEGLDMDTFRFVMPVSDRGQLPPEWRIEAELIDFDSLTGWLWAYWEGRWRGYW